MGWLNYNSFILKRIEITCDAGVLSSVRIEGHRPCIVAGVPAISATKDITADLTATERSAINALISRLTTLSESRELKTP